jgi:hypothetical protein
VLTDRHLPHFHRSFLVRNRATRDFYSFDSKICASLLGQTFDGPLRHPNQGDKGLLTRSSEGCFAFSALVRLECPRSLTNL